MDLAFDLNTYDARTRSVLARMAEQSIDALIVNLPDNINYLIGYDSIGYLWYQALILSPALDHPTFFTRTTEEPCTWETSCARAARFFQAGRDDPIRMVVDLLEEHGLASAHIGVEKSAFTFHPAQWDRLRELLPEARFSDATSLVAEVRLIKSPREIAYQRAAAQMADAAMGAGLAALRPGVSEVEVQGVIAKALGEAGSEYVAIWPMVASGPRSVLIHGMASNRAMCLGDVVVLELGASCRRYHSIVMRTAVLGRPSGRVREVAACLKDGMEAAIAAAKRGAEAGAPDRACNEQLARKDLVRRRAHRLGYSLGIAYPPTWLEAMMLDEADPHRLEPGMSFSIEPNLSLHDEGFGVKLGETVTCGENSGESLSALDHELVIVD